MASPLSRPVVSKMIVGFYQCASPKGHIVAGLEVVETALAKASESSVEMLVMPEAFLPGYGATPPKAPKDWDSIEAHLSKLCQHYGVALTIGLPEYLEGQVFNTALAIGAHGETLAHYRKIQLFGSVERALYEAGNNYVLFNYLGKRWGLLICYDVEFPEHVRALARQGAEIVLVPTANMMPFVNVNEVMVPSRAAENGISVVYANYCGSEGEITYTGRSTICGPDGVSIVRNESNAGLGFADLDDIQEGCAIPASTQLFDFVKVL